MENVLDFLANNYIWFLIAALVLAFALIGFIVDSKRKEKKTDKEPEVAAPIAQSEVSVEQTVPVTPEVAQTEATESIEEVPAEQVVQTEPSMNPEQPATEPLDPVMDTITPDFANAEAVEQTPVVPEPTPSIDFGTPINPEQPAAEPSVPTAPINDTMQTSTGPEPVQANPNVVQTPVDFGTPAGEPVTQTTPAAPNIEPNSVVNDMFDQPVSPAATQPESAVQTPPNQTVNVGEENKM